MVQVLDAQLAQLALDAAPVGVVAVDHNGRPTWLNPALRNLLGVRGDEPDLAERLVPLLRAQGEVPMLNPADGTEVWLRHSGTQPAGAAQLHFFEDVSELKALQAERDQLADELRKKLSHDALTGLMSRHAILQSMLPLVSLSRRYEKPLAIVFLEIGNLEQFDTAGSKPDASEVLVAVAHLLKDQLRWADLVGRYGPDQFLLVLPETTAADAAKLVEKIAPKLAHLDSPELPVQPVELAVNFGVSEWTKGDDAGRLVRRAAEAMNTAKESQHGHMAMA